MKKVDAMFKEFALLKLVKNLILAFVFLIIGQVSLAQNDTSVKITSPEATDYIYGYPPGWEALPGPGSGQSPQYLIVYSAANPRINGVPINVGDWIGVFYISETGDTVTGGAGEWAAAGIQFIAYGDYSPGTLPKNGFGYGESLIWKFFSWTSQKEYPVPALNISYETCQFCVTTNKYYPMSFAKVLNVFTNVAFSVDATATPSTICEGGSSQLNAVVTGITPPYTYSWTSNPTGFTSTLKNPVVNPAVNTQYTVIASDGLLSASKTISVTVQGFPAISAGSDASICQGQTHQLSGTASGYSSLIWSTSGNGTFNNPAALNPVYTPGTNDIQANGATLTLTVNYTNPCNGSKVDQMVLSIQKAPTSNAGNDQSICGTPIINLNGSASNYSSLLWTTSGSGTFSNTSVLNPTYQPSAADLTFGSANLTLKANPNNPCTASITDFLVLSLTKLPTANAGADKQICAGNQLSISEATASNYISLLWTTSGTGTFNSSSTLHPSYTPSQADINSGNVTLTLTVQPLTPCTSTASDFLILVITKTPTVNAGNDQSICGTTLINLNGSASNYSSLLWTTSGSGSFSSTSVLNPTYQPSAADLISGSVNLTLKANPNNPCTASITDFLVLSLIKLPTANAGDDKTVCGNSIIHLAGNASDYSSIIWSTSGTGDFSNINTLSSFYTPSLADLAGGSVILTLTVIPLAPCTNSFSDFLVLTLIKPPTSNAGINLATCDQTPVFLSGSAQNYSSIAWQTNGDGIFSDPAIPNTSYTPGPGDVNTGTVLLTLIAHPLAGCLAPSESSITLTISISATIVEQPESKTVMTGEDVQFEVFASGTLPVYYQWYGPDGIIDGETEHVIDLLNVQESDTGSYYCMVSNNCGAIESEHAVLNVQIYQSVVVPAGWSGISLYVSPVDPLIENLLAPYQQSLVILKNDDGIYWPSEQINTLINWNAEKGYAIKFIQPVQIQIAGTRYLKPISLNEGWNYLPVLSYCEVSSNQLFAGKSEIVFASDIAGNRIYWPAFGIYSLQVLEPGKAYLVKTTQSIDLQFPACNK